MTTPDRQPDPRRTEAVATPTEMEPTTATAEHPDWSTAPADPLTAHHPSHESTGPDGAGATVEPAAGRHAGVARAEPSPPPAEADSSTTPTGSGSVANESPAGTADVTRSEAEPSSEPSLFVDDDLAGLRAKWNDVQAGFVDDPRACVQEADGLVSDVVKRLTAGFSDARSRLEHQWGRGEEASTEDLRVALTRYRDFFDRLLAV
jgi:hypothetical protein